MSGILASQRDDPEGAHIDADHYLCEVLESLGYHQLVAKYKLIPKWYS